MASVAYTYAKLLIMNGTVDLDTDTIKAMLLMNNTTADTEEDVENVSAFATLAETDATGYTSGHGGSGRKTLALTAAADEPNNRAELTENAGTTVWSSLDASTNPIQGVLVHKEGAANDTTAKALGFFEFPSVFVPNGGDLTITWNAEGVFQIT